MLDLHKGARPDERFHLQVGEPMVVVTTEWWGRSVRWYNLILPDGSYGVWQSYWIRLFGYWVHWYQGTCKCDGTRTRMYWDGALDDGIAPFYTQSLELYVMTTTPKEMFSVRFGGVPSEPVWDNMGGA